MYIETIWMATVCTQKSSLRLLGSEPFFPPYMWIVVTYRTWHYITGVLLKDQVRQSLFTEPIRTSFFSEKRGSPYFPL